jgi:FMN phosphatase YigB (HAD superfamily)
MTGRLILCVDFDGVIHSYTSGWKGAAVIPDPPVPGALAWLWRATEWFDVQIYSSRSKEESGRHAMRYWMQMHAAEEFGHDHPMSRAEDQHAAYPITFAHEKPPAFLTIDDRAICFTGDWDALDPEQLLEFKPWYQRLLTR